LRLLSTILRIIISRLWAQKIETNKMLQPGSPWIEIDQRLNHYSFNKVIYSPYISPFFRTDLADWLQEKEIDTVILAGNSTSGCIRVTAIDSMQNGFRPMIPREAVGDRSNVAHQTALTELDVKYSDVISIDEAITYFQRFSLETTKEI
jgi:maleamate amidohydrolase